KTVETFIKKGEIISPPEDLPKEFLEKKAGTFVTIEKNGNLRGCIGTYLPTRENIAQEIIQNAIAAATEDYRFGPIQEKELSSLSYTVYILSEPELVRDIKELDPQKYGIIVKTEIKTGLLLPDLEGVDTIEQQLSITCQKGGIDPLGEKIFIYRFTVEKYQ
ncbi:AMMECR1 domain-containing protein, partial [Candidatus Falkowbacteria bacterium CG_4_9_14_3_um_filter_38_19]